MASIKRIWWFYMMIINLCCLEYSLCTKNFEIERRLNKGDTFSNDFIINDKGEWEKTSNCHRNNCKNAWLNSERCRCTCLYPFATYRMGAAANNSSCIRNSNLRSDEGCTTVFQGESMNTALKVINIRKIGRVVLQSSSKCNTFGPALYWDYGVWKPSPEKIFSLSSRYLQWNKTTKYSGRIVKQPLMCTSISTSQTTNRDCIMFKISGMLSYDMNRPPSTKVPPTTKKSTTKEPTTKKPTTKKPTTKKPTTKEPTTKKPTTKKPTTKKPTTKKPTTKKPTTKEPTTKEPTTKEPTTKKPTTKLFTSSTTTYQTPPKLTTKQSTTSGQTTHSLHTTHNTVKVSYQTTTTERHKHSTNEITEASEMPATEITEQSTTETDVVPGKKGARGESSDSESDNNTITIAAIGATAAIACLIIICIFLWFVVKRKKKNRNNEAYSTDMTVITNGTGMNNNSSAPTLKNPIYDNAAAYCEPTEKNHPKQLPMLGNPVYDKAIVINNNKDHQNNKNPSHKPKTKNDSNCHDKKDDDEAFDNPGYQDLIIKPGKNTANSVDYSDSTYDNTYAEPEKPLYEALLTNGGRDSIYQPLVHNNQSKETIEAPGYMALLNGNTRPEEQEIPEYLTLVSDETNQTQPQTLEYDYAFVDGQEEPNIRGADMSQQDPHVYGTLQDSIDKGTPVYGVLKDPDDKGAPVYGVLEDPNDQGPPVYDVLEDPNDKGPPVYDVLEDPNDQGPPVYDILEDPNDKGPPVYDVLEGPDSGDGYHMPVDGHSSKC